MCVCVFRAKKSPALISAENGRAGEPIGGKKHNSLAFPLKDTNIQISLGMGNKQFSQCETKIKGFFFLLSWPI